MSLPHGREISAGSLEMIAGREFSIKRFVSLCNSLVWAFSTFSGLAQLSFTERVYVHDSGIDAEWSVDHPEQVSHGSLLEAGWNVFQYKQRDVTSSDRHQIIAALRRNLEGAADEIFKRTGNRPSHYSLFTNVDLTHDDKAALADAIRDGIDGPLKVTVRGAGDIAAILNSLPFVRSAFFSIDKFSTWESAWRSHETASVAGKVPSLIGRAQIVSAVKASIDDANIRVVAITGPSGIGKNRLAFEATAHRPLDTIAALDAELGASDILQIARVGQDPIAIVDSPHAERTRELIGAAVSGGPKLVLTITDPRMLQQFNFGQDSRVRVFSPQALSETESRELLQTAGARLDYSVQSWVVQKSGGNPGVLIAAAAIGDKLRIAGPSFLEQVGDALEARARTLLGADGVQAVRLLSVMTAVGIGAGVAEEVQTLCSILGGITPNDIVGSLNQLIGSGFVRKVGNYLEVAPPALANRSAVLALAGREHKVGALLASLPPNGGTRLLRRIQQLPAETVRAFVAELFKRGPLKNLDSAVANVRLLRLLAPVAPVETASLLEVGLSRLSVHERLQLADGIRRDLVWTAEELLFRTRTSASALRSLRLLSEAENETYGNNATNIFEECFHPLHPQLPLPLSDRLDVIRQLASNDAKQSKRMAIRAGASAFNSQRVGYLRRSEGPEPFDAVPEMTYKQVFDYLRSILELLRSLMADVDDEVKLRAGEAYVQAVAEFTIRARPAEGVAMLEEIAARMGENCSSVRVEDYIEALHLAQRGLSSQQPALQGELARVSKLVEAIEGGTFDTRARRWVGTWDYGDHETDENGQFIYRGQKEIQKLSSEAASDPNIVPEPTMAWLTSRDAKRAYDFFFFLGHDDVLGNWESRVALLGRVDQGEIAFSCYYGGRAQVDAQHVDEKIERLLVEGRVRPEALLGAIAYLPADRHAVERIVTLLGRGLSPVVAERRLISGGWMKPLVVSDAATLLSAIAGPELDNAAEVIDFLAMWIHAQKPLEGDVAELGWACLESSPEGGEAWDFDLVAAALAAANLDRGFALLKLLLTRHSDIKAWEPLDRHSGNKFWGTLWALDRQRSLEVLFEAAASSPLTAWRVSWHIPEVLDLQTDQEFLQSFARKDIKSAEFVSSVISATKVGFWPVALDLLALHPENKKIRQNVGAAAAHINHVISGPMSEHYIQCAKSVEEVLSSDGIPGSTRDFLRELAANLRKEADRERRDEDDESVNWS